jgi:Transport and Golgi organisation 2
MCTVTYMPASNGYFLTSNRDEKSTRSSAIEPKEYTFKNTNIIFPKDPDANGTWIVLKENGDSLCLLNGAFTNFEDKGNYKKSRGLVVVEIASAQKIVEAFRYTDLNGIAPFTLIMVENKLLYECRWDGTLKHLQPLDNLQPHIWSSATLYDAVQTELRKKWFSNFLHSSTNIQQEDIISFHKNTGGDDTETNLVMNRNNKYFTVSVTSIVVQQGEMQMLYQDIISQKNYRVQFANEFANC